MRVRKTGGRELLARDKTKEYLDRQRAMNAELVDMTFDEVLDAFEEDRLSEVGLVQTLNG